MVQLSDDAAAFGDLATVEAALARLLGPVQPVAGIERLPLAEAEGRVLAENVTAPRPLPPFDNTAVDGYAVRFADLAPAGPTWMPVADRVAAGEAAPRAPAPGTAVRVFTGAPLPPGADTVFMQEDVRLDRDGVLLPPGLKRGANARLAGEDLAVGARALAAGRRLRPEDLGLAAALGLASLPVRRPPVLALFSTGNELAAAGAPLAAAQIYDANRPLLAALARRAGAQVRDLGILPDDRAETAAALARAAADADLILTSGGVSTGDEDHVKAAVEAAGRLAWWRVGIKPGRPVAVGSIGAARFMGLPGNPVAAFVTFAALVRPLLVTLGGEAWRPPRALPVRLGFAYAKKAGRREYVRVTLEDGPSAPDGPGGPIARKHPQDGAGVLTSLTACEGVVVLPESVTRLEAGAPAAFYSFAALG